MQIRPATPTDLDAMWELLCAVIAAGDALPFGSSFGRATFDQQWALSPWVQVAIERADVVGMYKLGANYPDRGAHVASATYVVSPSAQGRGIGRALVEHSLDAAREAGFAAMQFNYVVSTNTPAVALYRKLGFAVVGTLPQAFRHERAGLVDVYVMFRTL